MNSSTTAATPVLRLALQFADSEGNRYLIIIVLTIIPYGLRKSVSPSHTSHPNVRLAYCSPQHSMLAVAHPGLAIDLLAGTESEGENRAVPSWGLTG